MSHPSSYPIVSLTDAQSSFAAAKGTVGGKYKQNGLYSCYDTSYGWQTLRFVYLDDAVDAALGSVAECSDLGPGNVTVDRNGSVVGLHPFAGVFKGTVTATQYGFVVVGVGDKCFVSTGGSEAANSLLVVHTSTDKLATAWAPTSTAPTVAQMIQGHVSAFGHLLAADGSTGGAVILTRMGM